MSDKNVSDLGVSTVAGAKEFELVTEGKYDAVVHGIVYLGLVRNDFKKQDGTPQQPSPKIKLIMEIPDSVRGDGLTTVMGTDLTLSVSERGNFISVVSALVDKKLDEEGMAEYVGSKGLKELLGRNVHVTVKHWEKDGKTGASLDRKGFYPMDARLPKPKATRDTFFFSPFQPDLELFEKTLTYWTQRAVMSSESASQYPEELKKLWLKIDQEHNSKQSKSAAPVAVSNQTYAIE